MSSSCCNESTQKSSCDNDTEIRELPPLNNKGDFLCRVSDRFRMNYSVLPGLYTIGIPDNQSPVLVTANYRLTTNALRNALGSLSAWILVIDTKGINVWCAAGKGTFGTNELINRIKITKLDTFVNHRKIILPQLGAPGVASHEVTKATGFQVQYGPVRASDIPKYLQNGSAADESMRTVTFPVWERLVLTPMELIPALRKFVLVIIGMLMFFGIQRSGIMYKDALYYTLPLIIAGLLAIISGSVFFAVLLPLIPFRSFALKGTLLGSIVLTPLIWANGNIYHGNLLLASALTLFFIIIHSYVALNFTGCTTFTNPSGVKKEMRFAVPLYVIGLGVSLLMLIVFKLQILGVL
jgi:CO dehydrogenase/acetyl-CoA synthase delta subunit